eukprot:1676323-Amphidinium_carterae.1
MFVDRLRFFSDKRDVFDFVIVAVGLASQMLKSHLPSTGIFRLFRLSRLAKALYFVKMKGPAASVNPAPPGVQCQQ